MVSKILKFGKQKGSSTLSPAHGLGGSRATSSLVAHFALRNTKFENKKNIQTSSKKHNMVVICSTCAFGSGTLPTRICLAESNFRFVV